MIYQVAFNQTSQQATVQQLGDDLPSGAVLVGQFEHEYTLSDSVDGQSHVFYQHVQDLLANTGVHNMQKIRINWDNWDGV
jgi:hypothetical protein